MLLADRSLLSAMRLSPLESTFTSRRRMRNKALGKPFATVRFVLEAVVEEWPMTRLAPVYCLQSLFIDNRNGFAIACLYVLNRIEQ